MSISNQVKCDSCGFTCIGGRYLEQFTMRRCSITYIERLEFQEDCLLCELEEAVLEGSDKEVAEKENELLTVQNEIKEYHKEIDMPYTTEQLVIKRDKLVEILAQGGKSQFEVNKMTKRIEKLERRIKLRG